MTSILKLLNGNKTNVASLIKLLISIAVMSGALTPEASQELDTQLALANAQTLQLFEIAFGLYGTVSALKDFALRHAIKKAAGV